jgi:hypothetical protein
MGDWEMLEFRVTNFDVLPDGGLKSGVEALRAIPAAWKDSDNPIEDLLRIRAGERSQ